MNILHLWNYGHIALKLYHQIIIFWTHQHKAYKLKYCQHNSELAKVTRNETEFPLCYYYYYNIIIIINYY